jgi:hypothetical protein
MGISRSKVGGIVTFSPLWPLFFPFAKSLFSRSYTLIHTLNKRKLNNQQKQLILMKAYKNNIKVATAIQS